MSGTSNVKGALASVGDLMPPVTVKTRARSKGGSEKSHYKPLPKEFRRGGFTYKQIARERDATIYEQTWNGCRNPSVSYEIIRIRRRDGFQIGEKLIQPYEIYPNCDAWGTDGFTVTDRDKIWAKFFLKYRWKNQQGEEGR